jgi:hypothetical protein
VRYKSTDPKFSTSDWVSLSFSQIDQETITLAAGEEIYEKVTEILPDLDVPDFHVTPEEDSDRGVTLYESPDPDAYETDAEGAFTHAGAAAYQADLAVWKTYDEKAREEIREREERDLLPMWSTMWTTTDDCPATRAALFAAGFRLYDATEIGISGILFGIDGAGYGFYGSHWIPLRAACAADVLTPYGGRAPEGKERARYRREARALAKLLRAEAERDGDRGVAQIEALATLHAHKRAA